MIYIGEHPKNKTATWQTIFFTDTQTYLTGRKSWQHDKLPFEKRPIPIFALELRLHQAHDKYHIFIQKFDEFEAKMRGVSTNLYSYNTTTTDAESIYKAIINGDFPLTGTGYFRGVFTMIKRGQSYNLQPYFVNLEENLKVFDE